MKKHRGGGKFKGSHTTLVDIALRVVDIVERLDACTGISCGIVQSGKGVTGGTQKVKITKMSGGLLLTARQSRSVQEVRVYGPDVQELLEAVARSLRNEDIRIHFT